MGTEVQDVETFWQTNKYLSKAGFVKTHSNPFLVEVDPVEDDDDLLSFETLSSKGEQERSKFRRANQIALNSRIFRVEKKTESTFADKISVGRSPNNDIVLAHPSVSKFHAYFTLSDIRFEYSVTDVNSKNGTFLNDLPLTPLKKEEVRSNDRVSFGGEIRFLFLYPDDLFSRLTIMSRFMM